MAQTTNKCKLKTNFLKFIFEWITKVKATKRNMALNKIVSLKWIGESCTFIFFLRKRALKDSLMLVEILAWNIAVVCFVSITSYHWFIIYQQKSYWFEINSFHSLFSKGKEEDLEYYVRECGNILGVTNKLPAESQSAKHILEYVFAQVVEFKKLNQVKKNENRFLRS